jgi:hypothetical protein
MATQLKVKPSSYHRLNKLNQQQKHKEFQHILMLKD